VSLTEDTRRGGVSRRSSLRGGLLAGARAGAVVTAGALAGGGALAPAVMAIPPGPSGPGDWIGRVLFT